MSFRQIGDRNMQIYQYDKFRNYCPMMDDNFAVILSNVHILVAFINYKGIILVTSYFFVTSVITIAGWVYTMCLVVNPVMTWLWAIDNLKFWKRKCQYYIPPT